MNPSHDEIQRLLAEGWIASEGHGFVFTAVQTEEETPEGKQMTKPWIPSNGTGGEMFRVDWCDKCSRETAIRECGILTRTLIYKPGEPEYPKEWVADNDGWSNPRCTAFKARTSNGLRSQRIRDRRQKDLQL